MSQDDEILELERRIATGDLTAWPILDTALERAGRPPRRVWILNYSGGEYSDKWDRIEGPVHATKAGALAHLERFAAENDNANFWGPFVRRKDDQEEFVQVEQWTDSSGRARESHYSRLYLTWEELAQ